MKRRILIIGNGKAAVDCARIAQADHEVVGLVTEPAGNLRGKSIFKVPETMRPKEAENVNSIAGELQELKPDIIFSINNFQLLKEKIINIPPLGIINFHNGPLPRYAGLNVCSWAIVNGEREHGIAWHYVDHGVDTGNIIIQRAFPIDEEENALQLIMKSIQHGIDAFREMLPQVTRQRLAGIPQNREQRTLYKKNEKPYNGRVSFRWASARIYNFIRGLNFDPLENTFIRPSSTVNTRTFYIDKIRIAEKISAERNWGEIICADSRQILVQVEDARISLEKLRDEKQGPIPLSRFVDEYTLKAGMIISP